MVPVAASRRRTCARARLRDAARNALLALVALLAPPAAAVNYVWTAPVSGAWNDASKWTPNGIPNGPTDTATITVAGTYSVLVNDQFQVTNLALGGASGTQTLSVASGGVDLTDSRCNLRVAIGSRTGATSPF